MRNLKYIFVFVIISMMLTVCVFATSASKTVENIAGNNANVVYVSLSEYSNVTPVLANNSVGTDKDAKSIVSSKNNTVAAINGPFFASYYDKNKAIDVNTNNYPQIYGTVVIDGKMICSGGFCAIGFGYDGSVQIGRVSIKGRINIESDPYPTSYTAWGVNTVYKQSKAIYFLTDEFDYPVNIPSTSTVVYIMNGVITNIGYGYNGFVVPDNTLVMVVDKDYPTKMFEVGDKATYEFVESTGADNWNSMRNILGGGGLLVENGKNVVDNNGNVADDQKPDLVSSRTFVAITSDGRLMFGSVTGSFRNIADYLVSKGVKDAMYMDGGASSMIYSNTSSYSVSAGRKLASILSVIEDSPSSWAVSEIKAAVATGVVPENLQKNYTGVVKRSEVAQMFINLIEKSSGKDINTFLAQKNVQINPNAFSDTKDEAVLAANALGIINGVGNGKFNPNGSLKRGEIAAIINRTAKVLGVNTEGYTHSFTDITQSWLDTELGWPSSVNIVNGVGNGKYNPNGTLTTEQAILTAYRALNVLKK